MGNPDAYDELIPASTSQQADAINLQIYAVAVAKEQQASTSPPVTIPATSATVSGRSSISGSSTQIYSVTANSIVATSQVSSLPQNLLELALVEEWIHAVGRNARELESEVPQEGGYSDVEQSTFAVRMPMNSYSKDGNDGITDEVFVNSDQWLNQI